MSGALCRNWGGPPFAGTLSPDTTAYLAAMQSKYKIADIQKAVRIVLDYALEDGGDSLVDALVA